MQQRTVLRALSVALGLTLASGASAAPADSSTPPADPTFSSHTDNPDGSWSMTVGRRLPTAWDAKVGTDVSLSAPMSDTPSDNMARGVTPGTSTGAVWGNLTMPGLAPLGFDKTSLDARIDAGSDQGKIAATLGRPLATGVNYSVTLQNSYSVTQTLTRTAPAVSMPQPGAVATGPAPTSVWAADETLQFSLHPTGTTFSAGGGPSNADNQWHDRLSLEQTLLGPLKLTTSVEDAGGAARKESIAAGYKRVW